MRNRVFTLLLVVIMLAPISAGSAQNDELPLAPDAELESIILFPDALFQGESTPEKPESRYVLYAEEADTITIDVQRLSGSPGTQATLVNDKGEVLATESAEELENLILQHDAPTSGWYVLDIEVNAAVSSQFQMLLSGTTRVVYALLEDLPEEVNAIVLFPPATIRGGDYLIFVPSTKTLEVSGDAVSLTDLDGDEIADDNSAYSPEMSQWVLLSGNSEFSVSYNSGKGLTPRDFLPIPPNIMVDGTILEVTLFGDPLDALSSAAPGATIAETLQWGDRVLHQGNNTNIGGRIFLEVKLGDGSTAYIPDGAQLYVERDPNIVTEGIEVGSVIAITRDGNFSTLYSEPTSSSGFVEELRSGFQLTILDGPVYNEYHVWWQLQMADGRIGWAPDIPGWWRLFAPPPGS